MTDLESALRQVLRHAVDGRAVEPSLHPTRDTWSRLSAALLESNVPGLLAAALDAGTLTVDGASRNELFTELTVRLVNDLRAESECIRVTEVLQENRIACVVLKGLAVAHLDYVEPSHRSTTDVDLLIRPEELGRATDVLVAEGYRRDLPERRPGFDRRFAKDVTLYGPRHVEVDLHRTFLRGPFGAAIDLDELWSGQVPLEVDGLPDRRALDGPSRLLHACYTVSVADARPTLGNLCDVAAIASDPALDWDLVRRRSERWRAPGIVSDGLAAASAITGLELSAPYRPVPSRTEQRWRRLYGSGGGSLVSTTAGMVHALGPIAGAQYLADLAFPVSGYRRARRQAGRRSELRAVVDSIKSRYGPSTE